MKLALLGWNESFARIFTELSLPSCVPARIMSVDKYSYNVAGEFGESMAKISGSYRHTSSQRKDLPVVGDWVAVQHSGADDTAIIHKLLPRTTFLARKSLGAIEEIQVIAGNIDTVFIVTGLDHNFNLRRIERCIALVKSGGAAPVIVLSKSDLIENDEDVNTIRQSVAGVALDIPIHFISLMPDKSIGLTELDRYFSPGKTVILFGSSGVGKSSLTNYFLGSEQQRVGKTNAKDSKGRHTTTRRQLFVLPNGGMLIDTSGMREFQLWIDKENLDAGFADIEALRQHCRFKNCSHTKEPGCAIAEALQQGTLTAERLASYKKISDEQALQFGQKTKRR